MYTLGLQTPSETVFGDAVWDLKDNIYIYICIYICVYIYIYTYIYIYIIYDMGYMWRTAPPYHWQKSPCSVHQRRWRTATWWASASAAAWTPRPWPCACAWPASRRPWRGRPWRGHGGAGGIALDFKNAGEIPTGWWFQTWILFPFHIWDVILPID